jgi:hypothetical protein
MYHDILFINKHIVWRSIYVPYIFHLQNSENIQGRGVYGHGDYAISTYPHYSCQLKSSSRKVFSIQCLQGTCDKSVVFSETPVSSTNKTEIFLKVANWKIKASFLTTFY